MKRDGVNVMRLTPAKEGVSARLNDGHKKEAADTRTNDIGVGDIRLAIY